MKVFVTGVGGQLGHDVMNELANFFFSVRNLYHRLTFLGFLCSIKGLPCHSMRQGLAKSNLLFQ